METQQHPKLTIKQDGKEYDLYDLPDGFVIKGDVNLRRKCLTELPDLSKVIVKGDFCCNCNQLTSLKGAPQKVGGSFYCYDNKLISLEGAPQEIYGSFDCFDNKLTSLRGAPKKVLGNFDCSRNRLITLEGAPREVGGGFWCVDNKLETLKGAPEKCCFDETGVYHLVFSFVRNNVTSLQYLPRIPKDWREVRWGCHGNPLKVDDNIPDYVLENIHSLCGISQELKEQLVLKRRAQKLQLAQEKQRRHILHRNASRQR